MLRFVGALARAFLRRFVTSRDGSLTPIFAVTLLPIIASVGAGVDYVLIDTARTSLQASLDASLLAGARDGSTNWINTANIYFSSNFNSSGVSSVSPTFALDANRNYTGVATATVPIQFLQMLGISSVTVSVQATVAVRSSSGQYYCVMALNPSAQGALTLTGNASMCAPSQFSQPFGRFNDRQRRHKLG
jgi:hypothetical protein